MRLFGISAVGRSELVKYVSGKRLTLRQMVIAKCYECMGGYVDGKRDCKIAGCPLCPRMPYAGQEGVIAGG
jgi:hypothetical protein